MFSGELSNLRVVVGAPNPETGVSSEGSLLGTILADSSLVKLIATPRGPPPKKKRLKTNKLKFLESRNFINIIQCKKCKIFETIDILRISIFCNNSNNTNDDVKNSNHLLHVLTIVLIYR